VYELVLAMRDQGWRLVDEYCWHKRNCYPGKWPNRFRDSWERLYHFTASPGFKMRQESVMVPMGDWRNARLANLSDTDRTRDQSKHHNGFGKRVENWVGREMAYPTNVLHMATECGFKGHPAAFPKALPEWFIKLFTDKGDTVLDPFVGSGTAARESLLRNRRFIGFDINPIAVEITKLLVSPPKYESVRDALQRLKKNVKESIDQSYLLRDGRIASHYLWENNCLQQIWLRGGRGSAREELAPTVQDLKLIDDFNGYQSQYLRPPQFFSNSRINAHRDLTISDILTGRAQRNLDLLLSGIAEFPPSLANPLRLCLTAASGQMTKMVFAITKRGKTIGKAVDKVEVGSWVVGFWCPRLHFEVNVWNCFERRVANLLRAIMFSDQLSGVRVSTSLSEYYRDTSQCCIECTPCQNSVAHIKDHSVKLILTDPPHSDRIPYLELSELWNSILDAEPNFDDEIVISNAKEREKSPESYGATMNVFLIQCSKILQNDGFLILIYNARQRDRWEFVNRLIEDSRNSRFCYIGQFPCNYSARSVVQDNRKGGLRNDIALVLGNSHVDSEIVSLLSHIPNWSNKAPLHRKANNGL